MKQKRKEKKENKRDSPPSRMQERTKGKKQ